MPNFQRRGVQKYIFFSLYGKCYKAFKNYDNSYGELINGKLIINQYKLDKYTISWNSLISRI